MCDLLVGSAPAVYAMPSISILLRATRRGASGERVLSPTRLSLMGDAEVVARVFGSPQPSVAHERNARLLPNARHAASTRSTPSTGRSFVPSGIRGPHWPCRKTE